MKKTLCSIIMATAMACSYSNSTVKDNCSEQGNSALSGHYAKKYEQYYDKDLTDKIVSDACSSIVEVQARAKYCNDNKCVDTYGQCTGFIVENNNETYLITAGHIVFNDKDGLYKLALSNYNANGSELELVVSSKEHDPSMQKFDYAVFKVKHKDKGASNVKLSVLGDSDKIKVGTKLYTCSHALGFDNILSTGYITSTDLSASSESYVNKYKFMNNVPISPGSSGAPLFALHDGTLEVVGIINAWYDGQLINEATKINVVKEELDKIGNKK